MESATSTAIVITEQGARFPESIEHSMPGKTGVVIVSQAAGESATSFGERVARKLAKMPYRERPSFAVLSCHADGESTDWQARARIASALAEKLGADAELVVTAPDRDRRSMPEFLELMAATSTADAGDDGSFSAAGNVRLEPGLFDAVDNVLNFLFGCVLSHVDDHDSPCVPRAWWRPRYAAHSRQLSAFSSRPLRAGS